MNTLDHFYTAIASAPQEVPKCPEFFIVNIDDVVQFARDLRNGGVCLRRVKRGTWEAYHPETPFKTAITTILIDIFRATERGAAMTFSGDPSVFYRRPDPETIAKWYITKPTTATPTPAEGGV